MMKFRSKQIIVNVQYWEVNLELVDTKILAKMNSTEMNTLKLEIKVEMIALRILKFCK